MNKTNHYKSIFLLIVSVMISAKSFSLDFEEVFASFTINVTATNSSNYTLSGTDINGNVSDNDNNPDIWNNP